MKHLEHPFNLHNKFQPQDQVEEELWEKRIQKMRKFDIYVPNFNVPAQFGGNLW